MGKRRRKRQTKPQQAVIRSAEFIGWAIGGLEREIVQTRERLSALTTHAAKLRAQLIGRAGGGAGAAESTSGAKAGGRRKRRHMSPEARRRISEMMKKRWAERRKGKGKG